MRALVVVFNPKEWPLRLPGVQVVAARDYLADPAFSAMRNTRVFNLCRSYRYQNNGYYVSLLAAARGHKPLPSVNTIQDMKSSTIIRSAVEGASDVEELIQSSLASLHSSEFTLSVYFGRNLAKRYARLSRELFNLFPAPLLRAKFTRDDEGWWRLASIRPISMNDVPTQHRPFLLRVATEHFKGTGHRPSRSRNGKFDLAILHNPEASNAPSDPRALRKFARAAEKVGFDVSFISPDDYGRIAEFDALFIRDTTFVNHYTYRFAARAAAEGLVVIDDPESIVRCTNKVFLAEALQRYGIPTPKTMVVHDRNVDRILPELGLPCVLKQPDSAFSHGVIKAATAQELTEQTERLLNDSDLIIAQEFVPTDFDWRIGIFNRRPLFAARYHMAHKHWQIVRRSNGKGASSERFGKVQAIAIEEVPSKVLRAALKAANLIGDGLYGVDVKQFGKRVCVIEVNDNPSIESGCEDKILKNDLYLRIMHGLMDRVQARVARK